MLLKYQPSPVAQLNALSAENSVKALGCQLALWELNNDNGNPLMSGPMPLITWDDLQASSTAATTFTPLRSTPLRALTFSAPMS